MVLLQDDLRGAVGPRQVRAVGLPVLVPAEAGGGGQGLAHADGGEVVVLVPLDDSLSGGSIDAQSGKKKRRLDDEFVQSVDRGRGIRALMLLLPLLLDKVLGDGVGIGGRKIGMRVMLSGLPCGSPALQLAAEKQAGGERSHEISRGTRSRQRHF